MDRFEFATAARVVFGPGVAREAGALARGFGTRALVVTGRDMARAATVLEACATAGVAIETFAVDREPDVALVERGVAAARASAAELVIGCGGGSAIDTAKAISALVANDGPVLDYLEVIGRGRPLGRPGLPVVAIPTTAGTGSEVTRNAVIASPEHHVKVSLRHASMLPRVALVDPELTYGLPAALTASTGLDALTQLIEPYLSQRATPITDALCADGIPRAARALPIAVQSPRNTEAREAMALASLFGGLALANAGLGAVHGFAGPIGGAFPAPHGAICAALLPHVLAGNLDAIDRRAPSHPVRPRFDAVARWLTGRATAAAADAVAWIRALIADLHVAPLSAYGVTRADVPELVERASRSSSMKGNPIVLERDELARILDAAI